MSMPATQGQGGLDVLIVEDSRTQTERLRYYLERNGFSVRSAVNGRDALALLKEAVPVLVVSDVLMPEMDGYELCRRIRRDPELADLPVILLTGLSGATDVIDGLASGATDFLVKPYGEEAVVARIRRALTNRELRSGATSVDGVEVWFAGRRYTLDSDRTQSVDFLLSSFEDAIERNTRLNKANAQLKDALKRISTLERRFQNLMEFSPAGLLVVGLDGVIWYANQAAEKLFRRDVEELKGTAFPFALHIGEASEVTLALPDRETAIVEVRVVETTWGDSPARLVSMWDVTENVRLRQQLEELSLTDELTGLANRRGFMLLAEQQRKLVSRGHALVLLYMDLNDFKPINDTLGHAAGDAMLRAVGKLLRETSRKSDLAVRYGGEEFLIVLPDSPLAGARQRMEEIRALVRLAVIPDELKADRPMTISCGLAMAGQHGSTAQELIRAADSALYAAKAAGRDRVVVHGE